MPLDRARSIDDLADAVADADLVLSADAPLTLALDRRVQTPRLGRVAATPRSHASGEFVPQDDRALFFERVAGNDLPWKTAARDLDLCLQCWDYTGRVDAILEYDEFDTATMRETVALLESTPSSHRDLAEASPLDDRDVHVIDEASFSELDRTLVPDDATVVDPFDEGSATVPEVHRYASATAIVDAVVEEITPDIATAVAIVLDEGTPYSPLLEAELEAADIPYQGGPGFLDDDGVRLFLRLLQSLETTSRLTVGEVRPLLRKLGHDVEETLDERRVDVLESSSDHPAFERLADLRRTLSTSTFGGALDAFEAAVGEPLYDLRNELASLSLDDEPVTETSVNQLVYYLHTFEVPVERDDTGVLLANASSTAYVDRPIVFYVGLGEGWARTPPDYPWVDERAFIERDVSRFQRLLQNGEQRYLLVQEARAGDRVTPCPYLHEFFEVSEFEGFGDLPDAIEHVGERGRSGGASFPPPNPEPDPDPLETISQSSLNAFVRSPRGYYFGDLLETPTNYHLERGNLIHEAAELYVNAPATFEDADRREALLDAMVERIRPYVAETRVAVTRTRFDIGLDVIEAFLTAHPPTPAEYDSYGQPFLDNDLAEALGLVVDSPLCERWFESADLGGKGVVDLLADPQTVVDYKSGSPKDRGAILERASIDEFHDTPDFQVLLYLAQHRREVSDRPLEMRFVYPLGQVREMVNGAEPDLAELVTTVTYLPVSFSEFVARREVYDELTAYADSNPRCRVLDQLGYETYCEFFETHPLPRQAADPEGWMAVKDRFEALATETIGSYSYVSSGVESIFGDLDGLSGYLLEEDLDRFEAFLHDCIADINDCRTSRFPVTYGDTEPRWDYVNHRDLILKGER